MRWGYLAAIALLVGDPATVWAASQDFTVVNRTGYPIQTIRVTETGSRDWGNDVMGRETLKPGERVDIAFDRATKVCQWDLMVEYRDRTQAIWRGIDLCKVSRLALFWDVQTQATLARAE